MMKPKYLTLALLLFPSATTAFAADVTPMEPRAIQPLSVAPTDRRTADRASDRAYRNWKISLAPVFASQALDVASSYGMRESNPIMAGSDGRFGARGARIKLGTTAAALGIEYLIMRKHPRAAGVLSKVNWSVSIVTTGFAAHNFAIR